MAGAMQLLESLRRRRNKLLETYQVIFSCYQRSLPTIAPSIELTCIMSIPVAWTRPQTPTWAMHQPHPHEKGAHLRSRVDGAKGKWICPDIRLRCWAAVWRTNRSLRCSGHNLAAPFPPNGMLALWQSSRVGLVAHDVQGGLNGEHDGGQVHVNGAEVWRLALIAVFCAWEARARDTGISESEVCAER